MLSKIIDWSGRNRFLVLLATLFIVVAGVFAVLRTPIGFITAPAVTASRAVAAALALAQDADWLAEAAAHSGPLATREA